MVAFIGLKDRDIPTLAAVRDEDILISLDGTAAEEAGLAPRGQLYRD
jgi:hypothetical protein